MVRLILGVVVTLAVSSCSGPDSSGSGSRAQAGGDTTVANRTSSAFEEPAPNLNSDDLELHLEGDAAFDATFVTESDQNLVNPGLGPLFNHNACGACHIKNGRGLPVVGTGPNKSQALVRVSLSTGTVSEQLGVVPVPVFGIQLQDHAVLGVEPEGTVDIAWEVLTGAYGDGTPYELRRPNVTVTVSDGSPLPADVLTSFRVAPPVFGRGLLEGIPEATLVGLSDPDDSDGDGISGRLNRVWDLQRQETAVGRFGWKASDPTLREQAADAFIDDMGVSNPLQPGDDPEPDIGDDMLDAATFYVQTLAVPAQATFDPTTVEQGRSLFLDIGCGQCHVPELETGDHPIAALSRQQIAPFTDMLLHDMGDGLADGRPDFEATGSEWRTPPLWGIGLTGTVLGATTFLHDGRARSFEEAILWHGGEAEASKESFRTLAESDRNALLRFLLSL